MSHSPSRAIGPPPGKNGAFHAHDAGIVQCVSPLPHCGVCIPAGTGVTAAPRRLSMQQAVAIEQPQHHATATDASHLGQRRLRLRDKTEGGDSPAVVETAVGKGQGAHAALQVVDPVCQAAGEVADAGAQVEQALAGPGLGHTPQQGELPPGDLRPTRGVVPVLLGRRLQAAGVTAPR